MSSETQITEHLDSSWIANWGKDIGSTDMATRIAANDRLSKRALKRVAESIGIDLDAKLDENERQTIEFYATDPTRLETLCGLVMNGAILRSTVSKQDFEKLATFFSIEDLRHATSLRNLHPNQARIGIDLEKLPRLINDSGKACILAWKATLSAQSALRLRLREDASIDVSPPDSSIDLDLAKTIVETVVDQISKNTLSLAA